MHPINWERRTELRRCDSEPHTRDGERAAPQPDTRQHNGERALKNFGLRFIAKNGAQNKIFAKIAGKFGREREKLKKENWAALARKSGTGQMSVKTPELKIGRLRSSGGSPPVLQTGRTVSPATRRNFGSTPSDAHEQSAAESESASSQRPVRRSRCSETRAPVSTPGGRVRSTTTTAEPLWWTR